MCHLDLVLFIIFRPKPNRFQNVRSDTTEPYVSVFYSIIRFAREVCSDCLWSLECIKICDLLCCPSYQAATNVNPHTNRLMGGEAGNDSDSVSKSSLAIGSSSHSLHPPPPVLSFAHPDHAKYVVGGVLTSPSSADVSQGGCKVFGPAGRSVKCNGR